ncbi:MAG: chromosomal replication initiator protein DnaA [bacterium]|nr:chromosomal replication initiator protein DnaA [bacterium]MCM1422773.1 chromosomal replication initiator protein DnaA [bacterium]
MRSIRENWEEIKETVRKEFELTDVSFDTWIKPLRFYKEEQDHVVIMIPSDQSHALNYISSKYKNFFKVIISEMMEKTYDISFILEKDVPEETENIFPETKNSPSANYENASLNPKYKFDTFVVGSNNKLAHSAALAVAESPGEVYNPLYIYGGAGLGKTHLMHSIGHFILERNPDRKVLYVTSENFTNEVIENIRSGDAIKLSKMREKYRTVDVLMIDDIQFIIGKESTQEEFFHTFNTLHSMNKQVILSSDRPPREMETLEERFRSRFEWGLITDIQPPDYETRMAILKKNIESYHKEIDDEVLDYIAVNITTNIRELEGALNKIFAFSKLNNVDINMDNAEEALKDVIFPNEKRELTPALIIDVTAEHFGIRPEDIISKNRASEIVMPRQIVMYLCRNLMNIPLQTIGKILGNRDHSTVLHGIKKMEAEIKTNEDLVNKIEIIKKKVTP